MRSTLSRLLAAVFAVFIFAGTSEAQIAGFDVGVTAGVNLATVSGDESDAKNLTGFMAGVSFIRPVSSMFSFQPEIAYSMKGAKFEEAGEEFKIKFAYIDIPLLAKISLGTAMTTARPALYVGPYAAINVGCDAEAIGESFDCEDDLELDVKTVDFGLIGGVGVDVGRINVFARYQFGLTSITDEEGDDAKHRVIQIGGRFSFRGIQ